MGDVDDIDFHLAEGLGLSLGQVRALPESEIVEWRAFYKYRAAMDDLAARSR